MVLLRVHQPTRSQCSHQQDLGERNMISVINIFLDSDGKMGLIYIILSSYGEYEDRSNQRNDFEETSRVETMVFPFFLWIFTHTIVG